jgi:hypothetical protein
VQLRALLFPVVAALALVVGAAGGRSAAAAEPTDAELLRKLAARVEQLERQLAEVKGEVAVAATDPAPSYPSVRFSGYGDVAYHAVRGGGTRSRFQLGQLDFFLNSRVSDKAGILAETVIEADAENNFGVEIERLLFQYKFSDLLELEIGRYHTSLGYYNTAFHHGSWFQTATGRPGFLDFEDRGGLIPAHNVGLSIHGALPVAPTLGLRYIAEIGNGRPYRDPARGHAPVLNLSDDNAAKSVNLALQARPAGVPGLQFGAGVYLDTLSPDGLRKTEERILHAHVVFKNPVWEFIGEAYEFRHRPEGGRSATSRAGLLQLARQFGDFRPYARYTHLDVSLRDAAITLVGGDDLPRGPAVGLRWDFETYATLKAQYEHQRYRARANADELVVQLAFTF